MARRLDEPSNTRLQRRGPSRTCTGFPVRRSSHRNDRPPTTRLAFRIAERFVLSSRGSGISVSHVCRPSGRTTTQQTERPAHGGPDDRPDDTGVGLVAASDLPGKHMTAANPQDSSDGDPSTRESGGRRWLRTPGPCEPPGSANSDAADLATDPSTPEAGWFRPATYPADAARRPGL